MAFQEGSARDDIAVLVVRARGTREAREEDSGV